MKKVFLIGNYDIVIYNFRHELIERLLQEKYEVVILLPYGPRVELLIKEGCTFYETEVDRRGTSIWKDLKLFLRYCEIMRREKPDIVLTYTIKPNVYGGIAAGIKKIPFVANITGLGSAVENKGVVQKVSLLLYRIALKKATCVFFQNEDNKDFFHKIHIGSKRCEVLPGSGVNIRRNQYQEYPKGIIKFVFAGRLMKEKGIEEYLYVAEKIKKVYPSVEFHICGFCEEEYMERVEELQNRDVVIYHGMVNDMCGVYRDMSCLILPSYHEGMSNVLLEAAANGRPGIASDISGCREIIVHKKTGFLFEKKNREQLYERVKRFIELPYEDKQEMGQAARIRVEENFDRDIIVEKYLNIIKEL